MPGILNIIVVISFLFFLYLLIFPGWFYGYSEGERTGDVFKFSKKGLIWKSWEGELYLGGLTSNKVGGLEIEKFYFSIPSKQENEKRVLIDKLKECSQKRLNCTINYKQWFKRPVIQESKYNVTNVILPK